VAVPFLLQSKGKTFFGVLDGLQLFYPAPFFTPCSSPSLGKPGFSQISVRKHCSPCGRRRFLLIRGFLIGADCCPPLLFFRLCFFKDGIPSGISLRLSSRYARGSVRSSPCASRVPLLPMKTYPPGVLLLQVSTSLRLLFSARPPTPGLLRQRPLRQLYTLSLDLGFSCYFPLRGGRPPPFVLRALPACSFFFSPHQIPFLVFLFG